jgi:acetyl esterase/lipase
MKIPADPGGILLQRLMLTTLALSAALFFLPHAAAQTPAVPANPVTVDKDGTVHVPAQSVPQSAYLSSEAKAYVTQHLKDMQNPPPSPDGNGIPGFMLPYIQRQKLLYPVETSETRIGGVHVVVYTPKSGISARNKGLVLLELHGGGFSGCWPGCAELESMPIASLGRIKVIAVDYREGPAHKFPAASEDVAVVYQQVLRSYPPQNIGLYGCSAGGMLTAMSVSWFQVHNLPRPGAIGIYCSGAGTPKGVSFMEGDAAYTAMPLGEARVVPPPGSAQRKGHNPPSLGYLEETDPADPLVNPVNSVAVLSKFPPTLIITGTRDFALSGALYTDEQLSKAGVDAELHVWEGLFHGFFYNPDVPESRDAYNVMIHFFEKHLGHRGGSDLK